MHLIALGHFTSNNILVMQKLSRSYVILYSITLVLLGVLWPIKMNSQKLAPFPKLAANKATYTLQPRDSISKSQLDIKYKDPFWKHTIAPAVFLGLSGVAWNADSDVRQMRNRYTPGFRNKLDNYTQYAPGATAFALNLSGVKGRNKIGRAVINWGGGMLIMGGLVNIIKYSAKVMRPDGTTRNSFPSGHTATAFMNATFLHKEYGHVNPLYSVLGYSMSTYTGISRSLNNRHWLSDILAGAGIGILSTELSYLIINSIYKNKGDYFTDFDIHYELENPSFVSVRAGQSFYIDTRSLEKFGLEGAIEGAYYFNNKWGIGGEIGFLHMPFDRDAVDIKDFGNIPKEANPQIDIESFGFSSFMVGGYYAKILSNKFILQGKVLTGLGVGVGGEVNIEFDQTEGKQTRTITQPIMDYDVKTTWVVGGGVSITGLVAPTLGLSLFVDYKYANPSAKITLSEFYTGIDDRFIEKSRLKISALTAGVKISSFF